MHDSSGLKRLLPHGNTRRFFGFLFRPILGLVFEILGRDRQTEETALGKSFLAALHQGFVASPAAPCRECRSSHGRLRLGAAAVEPDDPSPFPALKPRCTPGVQRTIHRLVDQGALDRMEARIYADPSLMTIRRCTVEHPFGTIERMSGGGRFLTRGLRAVKAEAALSILAFNILHAVNAFGTATIRPS